MVRRVSLKDIADSSAPVNTGDAAGMARIYANISALAAELESAIKRVDVVEKQQIAFEKLVVKASENIVQLGAMVAKLQQYAKDHDKLHADMSKASGDSQKDLMKLVRNVVAQTDIVQMAIKDALNRGTDVNVKLDAPPVNVDVKSAPERPVEVIIERVPWKVKPNRDRTSGVVKDYDLIPTK